MQQQGPGDGVEQRLHELMQRSLDGDARAYAAFLTAMASHLRAYFRRRMTALPDEVEDLVQEVLLAMHNQRHTYDPDRLLTPWAHAIAKYKFVDYLRAHGRRGAHVEPLDDTNAAFAATDDGAADARRDLDKLLDKLPERQRLSIRAVKIEGRSVAETARAAQMSESAVKVSIHRGLKALAALARKGG